MIILVNSAPQDAFNAFNADGQVVLGLIKPELLLRDMTDGVLSANRKGGIVLMTELTASTDEM